VSIDFPNTQYDLGLTRYWGGPEREMRVQLTQLQHTTQAGKYYVSVSIAEIPKLIADLARVFNADGNSPKLIAAVPEPQMNQQQQIDIIQAHMDGKRVMVCWDFPVKGDWVEVAKGEYSFDFRNAQYKIEPRRVELFMSLPSGVLQALGRDTKCGSPVFVSNQPAAIPQGHVLVKINYLEP
jgi:hypothetical protein